MIISSLLDNDYYKFTMHQAMFHNYADATAKYRFICRNKGINLAQYIEEITLELNHLCNLKFTSEEIDYLKTLGIFQEDYLDYLKSFKLDFKNLHIQKLNEEDILIEAEGGLINTTMFEIYTLAIVNEVYFKNTQPQANSEVAKAKLLEKINLIKAVNEQSQKVGRQPFKLIDFGTRRRFSGKWQMEVNKILNHHLPAESFLGTSSVYVAKELGINPIGTFAHEWLQAHQVFADAVIDSQKFAFEVWLKEYEGKLAIALSDIFGNAAFKKDFSLELATKYQGARHDSGDPFEWGEMMIKIYENFGIDPKTKTLVFSDGLDVPKAIALYEHFADRINLIFGIGTNLTNDFGFKALNIVMKMVSCNGQPVAKLSQEPSKAICDSPEFLAKLKTMFGINS